VGKRDRIRRFDEATARGRKWHRRQMSGEGPDESRVSLFAGLVPRHWADEEYPVLRALVRREVLRARTVAECQRARALLAEWCDLFLDDVEMAQYGAFLARMEAAWRKANR
jgi:hypothetical protein